MVSLNSEKAAAWRPFLLKERYIFISVLFSYYEAEIHNKVDALIHD